MNPETVRSDRKVLQLCARVARTLTYAFGESRDEVVRDLYVDAVTPYPHASRLLVLVLHQGEESRAEVLERLDRIKGALRTAVAESIHRKRTPELVFELGVPIEEPSSIS